MSRTTTHEDGAAEKLRKIAAELREHPEHWTQRTTARTASGFDLGPSLATANNPEAACWCALGLLVRDFLDDSCDSVLDVYLNPAYGALDAAIGSGDDVPKWNDSGDRTAAEVADAFDRAADLLDAEVQS